MKKMNKRFVAGTAFAVSATAALVGCGIPQPAVYGPPEYFDITESVSEEETFLETATDAVTEEITTAINEYATEEEIMPALYGPPEDLDMEPVTMNEEVSQINDFQPETEILEDVYGPPEYFD